MKIRYFVFFLVIVFVAVACTTSSLSRREIERLASGLTYITVPASAVGTSGDVRVHYVEAGEEETPPMILIHGFASNAVTWRKCMPELSKKYHVFALDIPGFGFSDKPPDYPYNNETNGKVVLNFMEQKAIDKAIIGGNSMGGGISLRVAVYHPEKLTHLILVDALGYSTGSRPGLLSLAGMQWLRPLAKPLFGKYIIRIGLKQVYFDDSMVTPELVEDYGRPFKTKNGKNVPFWMFSNKEHDGTLDLQGKIKEIKIPTLIIWGENDQWIPVEHAHRLKNDIEGSELVVIPECGHVPEEEKPEEVLKAIFDFLQKNP